MVGFLHFSIPSLGGRERASAPRPDVTAATRTTTGRRTKSSGAAGLVAGSWRRRAAQGGEAYRLHRQGLPEQGGEGFAVAGAVRPALLVVNLGVGRHPQGVLH